MQKFVQRYKYKIPLHQIIPLSLFQGEYLNVIKLTIPACEFLDASDQENILRHDGDSPGVDSTQIRVLHDPNKEALRSLLEGHQGPTPEHQIVFKVLGYLTH